MVCYRRHGHNEGDEPSFTQPLMYEKIRATKPVRERYTEALLRAGRCSSPTTCGTSRQISRRSSRARSQQIKTRAARARRAVRAARPLDAASRGRARESDDPETGVPIERLAQIAERLGACAARLRGAPEARSACSSGARKVVAEGGPIDWAHGRGARVRHAARRGHAGAALRPGQLARHLQPAPRGARRPARPASEYAPLDHARRDAGALRGLRQPALRGRACSASSTATALADPTTLVALGGAVRRLRERRAGDHRPVHRVGARPSGSA